MHQSKQCVTGWKSTTAATRGPRLLVKVLYSDAGLSKDSYSEPLKYDKTL